MRKILAFITSALLAFAPATVFADSPTTQNNGGGYDPCAVTNPALAGKGCVFYLNGQYVTSNGDGTFTTSAGNIFDANGNLVGTVNGSGNATVTRNVNTAGNAYVFRFTRADDANTFDHFVGVEIDGVRIDTKNYTAERGSVIITLKKEVTDTLSEGKHTITALFDDGENQSREFYVGKNGVPNTNDEGTLPYALMLGASVMILSGAGYILVTNKN